MFSQSLLGISKHSNKATQHIYSCIVMASFDCNFEPICSWCRKFDLCQAATNTDYKLHDSLKDLRTCGKTCGLCQLAYDDACKVGAKQYSTCYPCDPGPWHQESDQNQAQFFVSILARTASDYNYQGGKRTMLEFVISKYLSVSAIPVATSRKAREFLRFGMRFMYGF